MSDSTNTPNEWPGRSDDSWATGDPNTTAPIGPPPAGAPVGLVEPPPPAVQQEDWQGKYESERKRSRVFLATTALAGALLVGSLFYASAQGGSAGTDVANQQVPGMGTGPGMGRDFGDDSDSDGSDQFSGPGMGGRGMDGGTDGMNGMAVPPGTVEQFFDADGSLSAEAVTQFKEQLDAAGTSADTIKQALAAQIEGDVARGHITEAQAQELIDALGLDSSGSGDDGTGTGTGT